MGHGKDRSLQLASNPATSAEELMQLADSADDAVRAAVAANPNTSLETLLALTPDYPQQFLDNPALPLLLLERPHLFAEAPPDALKALLRCEACPRAGLDAALTHATRVVRDVVQDHIAIAGEVGDDWRDEPLRRIRTFAAHSLPFDGSAPAIAPELLDDVGPSLLPPWLIEACAGHRQERIRQQIAAYPDTPDAVLDQLARDEAKHVRVAVAARWRRDFPFQPQRRPLPESIHALLAQDSVAAVRSWVALDPHASPTILQLLAHDADWSVREHVAQNARLPVDILNQLASDESAVVRNMIAAHPAASRELLRALADDPNPDYRAVVASNPMLAPALLALLSRDTEAVVREEVAANPTATVQLLARLADDPVASVRRWVVVNANTPRGTLDHLAQDIDAEVREFAAANPLMPPNALEWLATDEVLLVRKRVAENPATPAATIQVLATDTALYTSLLGNPALPDALRQSVMARWLALLAQSHLVLEQVIACAASAATPALLTEYAAPKYFWALGFAVARNPGASDETLRQLAHDGNRYIRAAARDTLAQRLS